MEQLKQSGEDETRTFVIVSGGSGGIGSELCRQLARLNITPIICYYNGKKDAEKLALVCSGYALEIDMASDKSISNGIEKIENIISNLDVLRAIVLAASPPPELLPFGKMDGDTLSYQLRVNVVGAHLLLAGLIRKYFRRTQSGTIVGVLSNAIGGETQLPVSGMSAYVTAKIALGGMLAACQSEHPWLNVRSIKPGFTVTRMLDVFDSRYLEASSAVERFSTAEEVAKDIMKLMQI